MQLQDLTEHYDTAHIAKGFLLPASEQMNSTESVVFMLFQQTLKRKNGLKITYKKSDIQTYFNVAYLINVIGFEHVSNALKWVMMGRRVEQKDAFDGFTNKNKLASSEFLVCHELRKKRNTEIVRMLQNRPRGGIGGFGGNRCCTRVQAVLRAVPHTRSPTAFGDSSGLMGVSIGVCIVRVLGH